MVAGKWIGVGTTPVTFYCFLLASLMSAYTGYLMIVKDAVLVYVARLYGVKKLPPVMMWTATARTIVTISTTPAVDVKNSFSPELFFFRFAFSFMIVPPH